MLGNRRKIVLFGVVLLLIILANFWRFAGSVDFEEVYSNILPGFVKFSVPAGFHGTLIASVVNKAGQWDSGLFKLQLDAK